MPRVIMCSVFQSIILQSNNNYYNEKSIIYNILSNQNQSYYKKKKIIYNIFFVIKIKLVSIHTIFYVFLHVQVFGCKTKCPLSPNHF